jgi:tetratricopeptide (TPR) repeat protein
MDIIRILFDKGDIAAATDRIEGLLENRPGNLSLLKLLFSAQTANLNFGAAEKTLEKIDKAYGTSLRRDAVNDLTRQLLQNRGEPDKAAEYLESIKTGYEHGGPPARRFLSRQLISLAVSSGDYSKAHGLAVELTGGESHPLHALQDRIIRDVLAYSLAGTEGELAEAVESIAEAAAEFENTPYPKDENYFLAVLYSGGMPVEDILRKKRYWTSSLWENDFLFYAGLKALRDGDEEKAKTYFRRSMEVSVGYNSPYHAAKRELGKLDTE